MNQDATNPGDPSYESGLRSENLLVGSGPTHSRFTEFVCWCAILSTSLFIVYFQYVNSKPQPGDAVKVDTTTFELLSKMLFSIRKLSPAESQTEDLKQLNTGSVQQRLAYVTMLAEFEDEKTGLSALDELENEMKAGNYAPDETQQKLIEIVSNVLLTRQRQPKSFDSTEFAESDKEFLVEHLGWLGRLLLTPKFAQDQDQRKKLVDSAIMSTVTISLITLPAVLFGLAGILLAILAIRLYLMNALRVGVPDNVRSGTVYLETFTLWLLAFFGVQIATGIVFHTLAQGAPDTPTMTTARMLAGPIITFGSLLVLVWPVLRGKKFSEVRDDIGWRFSRPWTEGFMGILGYCAGMPMLVASFFVVLLLFVLTTLSSQPVSEFAGIPQVQQPIQELLGDGNVFAIIVAFFAACICAPIVEETMFRGVFYRYLRDQTSGIGRIASVIVSALLNGVIFAAIHPQGLVALPALTCLAVTFSFLRQWRGSLLAPMFVHGMHNGFLVLTLIALM